MAINKELEELRSYKKWAEKVITQLLKEKMKKTEMCCGYPVDKDGVCQRENYERRKY